MRGKMIALLVLMVLVTAGWTGGWFFVRGKVLAGMDRTIGELAGGGVEIMCPERRSEGWPFRIEITCEKPSLRLPDGTTLTAARLAAIGVVDDPYLVRVAVEAPARLVAPDGTTVDAAFAGLAASIRHDGERLVRLSVAADELGVDAGVAGRPAGRLTARHGEFHLRPAEGAATDLQAAASLTAADVVVGATPTFPAPADIGLDAVLRQAALFDGRPEGLGAWAAAGGAIELLQAAVVVGETRISATGSAKVQPDGKPDAVLTATATGIGWLGEQAKAGKPMAPVLGTLASSFLLLGRKGDGDARTLELAARGGRLTANGLPLGAAPTLF